MLHLHLKRQAFLFIAILFIVLSGCQKNSGNNNPTPSENDTIPHLLKIIDWEAANYAKDTVPEYIVQYTGDSIIALKGKYNDSITFRYELNPSKQGVFANYNTSSRIIRRRNLGPYSYTGNDTCDFETNDYKSVQALKIVTERPDNSNAQVVYSILPNTSMERNFRSGDYNGNFHSDTHIEYDADGDPTLIIRSTVYTENTSNDTTEIIYASKKNLLSKVDKNLSLFDPSCRKAESYLVSGIDPNANTFPFSIHYGTKCISSFKIISNDFYLGNQIDHNESVNQVSYEYNLKGYVTKILINNQPFKEFVYQN